MLLFTENYQSVSTGIYLSVSLFVCLCPISCPPPSPSTQHQSVSPFSPSSSPSAPPALPLGYSDIIDQISVKTLNPKCRLFLKIDQ